MYFARCAITHHGNRPRGGSVITPKNRAPVDSRVSPNCAHGVKFASRSSKPLRGLIARSNVII